MSMTITPSMVSAERSTSAVEIPLANIAVPPVRARRLREDKVAELAGSIRLVGQIEPILITRDGRLVAGLHRLRAHEVLGLPTVRAEMVQVDPLQAELIEIDENLMRADLTVFEQAQHLQRREEILASLGLRAQRGDNQHSAGGDAASPPLTTADLAAQMGISERSAQKRLQIARGITPEAAEIIAGLDPSEHALPDSTEDLRRLVRMEQARQVEVARRIASGAARDVRHARMQIEAEERQDRLRGVEVRDDNRYRVIHGDAAEVLATLPDESVDVIITDPPYPREYLHLYGLLAEQGARLLKPGGSLLAVCGQSYLPHVLELLTPHLTYQWTLAYMTSGRSPKQWQRKVYPKWKPVLWFVKGEYTGEWLVGDVINSPDDGRDLHEWQQSEGGMEQLVERFSKRGDLVLDCFCGAGTTGVAALGLGRRFLGVDIDPQAVETSRQRLSLAAQRVSGGEQD